MNVTPHIFNVGAISLTVPTCATIAIGVGASEGITLSKRVLRAVLTIAPIVKDNRFHTVRSTLFDDVIFCALCEETRVRQGDGEREGG